MSHKWGDDELDIVAGRRFVSGVRRRTETQRISYGGRMSLTITEVSGSGVRCTAWPRMVTASEFDTENHPTP